MTKEKKDSILICIQELKETIIKELPFTKIYFEIRDFILKLRKKKCKSLFAIRWPVILLMLYNILIFACVIAALIFMIYKIYQVYVESL